MTVRRTLIAAFAVALLGTTAPGPAQAGLFSGVTVDGPSPDISALGNISVNRDGSGGVIYLKRVGGVAHVFASVLSGGAWGTPQQLDSGLAGASSQPAIAGAANGRVVAVFVNGGTLYAGVQDSGQTSFATPQAITGTVVNPALAISTNGTAYASFTSSGPAGSTGDVYAARLDRTSTSFQLVPGPLNLDPSRSAGYDETTRSQVSVGTDGQALVTWGESGGDARTHVIARRVSGQGASAAAQDLTLSSLDGQPGGSADTPSAYLRDASDFGWVVFRQTFMVGGQPVTRAIARFQRGSSFDDPITIDPLGFPTADGAAPPQIETDGDGDGVAVIGLSGSRQVFADPVMDPDSLVDPNFGTPERIDSATNAIAPQPVIAIGGIDDVGGAAWEQSTGGSDPPSIHVRAFTAAGFGTEGTVSDPSLGPVDTSAGGLSGAADRYGDAFFAFLQGDAGSHRVMVGGVANPPTDFDLLHARATNSSRPVLAWTASSDLLGLAGYQVVVDGNVLATVPGQRFQVPVALPDGPHRVTVFAVDRYGQRTASPTHLLRVDTRRPRPRFSVSGGRSAGHVLRIAVHGGDGPRSSGIATAVVQFGDGARAKGTHVSHVYRRPGSYTVRVVVTDRAGNVGSVRRHIHVG